MKPLSISLTLAVVLAAAATPTLARDVLARSPVETLALKDGSTLYLFKDGKMARESQRGRVLSMTKGEVIEAADGRRITVTSNESERLNQLLFNHGD